MKPSLSNYRKTRRPNAESHDIQVQGARTHNLADVSLAFPRDALVVFTGVSGSGKSSLAFDTIYAEAQRRYIESVASHARRLIDQAAAPKVDEIVGLPPAVALQQSRTGAQERSSVGSLTRLSVTLRLLFSRAGLRPPGTAMLAAESFSPNNPHGACPVCHGLGVVHEVQANVMVPDDTLSIRQGAIACWPNGWQAKNLCAILSALGYDVDAPWKSLHKADRDWILFTQEQPSVPIYVGLQGSKREAAIAAGEEPSYTGTYSSARRNLLQSYSNGNESARKRLSRFVTITQCPDCQGKRLRPEALTVTFAGYDIAELSELTVTQLRGVLLPYAEQTAPDLPAEEALRDAVVRMSSDICARTQQLSDLGLGHLSLARRTTSLSSGELQRVRLATQLISKLFGVLYVLDEPSAGLHPGDVQELMKPLMALLDSGNSLLIVEHNLEVIGSAEWVVDVGPGPGVKGGQIVYSGPPAQMRQAEDSITANYLFNESGLGLRRRRAPTSWLKLKAVSCNNIQGLDVDLPLERMTVLTGVSGSGKSTLLARIIPSLLERVDSTRSDEEDQEDAAPSLRAEGTVAEGGAHVKRLVRIDQRPIGRTPRSNLATYTGFFDTVRKLFAETDQARRLGFDASRFSFNLPAGRCPVCEGQGQVTVELMFMPSASAPCSACGGSRYNEQTLSVQWQDRSIAEVLDLTVDDAQRVFDGHEGIQRSLRALTALGLGYLRIGQPATELSGGECQRIKLAYELQKVQRNKTLYLLDEPTSGLHPSDMDRLMAVLDELVQRGHTVIMAEHDMRVAVEADWIIDLGPGAGPSGGQIVACGAPETVAASIAGRTGPHLKKQLEKRMGDPL